MKGTEKQIKWAEEIKAKMQMDEAHLAVALELLPSDKMGKLMAAIESRKLGDCPIATLLEKWNSIYEQKDEAAWWIDHRRRNDIGGVLLVDTADRIITNEMIETL